MTWIAPRKRVSYGLAARRLGQAEFVQAMDTKTGKKFLFTGDEWRDLLDAFKAGAFDNLIPDDDKSIETEPPVVYNVIDGDPTTHGVGPVFAQQQDPIELDDLP